MVVIEVTAAECPTAPLGGEVRVVACQKVEKKADKDYKDGAPNAAPFPPLF
jgi:hypothetical protein